MWLERRVITIISKNTYPVMEKNQCVPIHVGAYLHTLVSIELYYGCNRISDKQLYYVISSVLWFCCVVIFSWDGPFHLIIMKVKQKRHIFTNMFKIGVELRSNYNNIIIEPRSNN